MEHLNCNEQAKLKKILDANNSVFQEPKLQLTYSTRVECAINTNDDVSIHQKVYLYPAAYTQEVNNQIKTLLDNGIIRPSHSAWTAPVWIVPKKNRCIVRKKNSYGC